MPAASAITGSVSGRILNEQGIPITNASIKIGISLVVTDVNGAFNTPAISLDKYLTSVQVSAPGYYTSYRSISAHPTKNYISISLIAKTLAGSFNNNSGGIISLSNGTSLTFGANSFLIKSSGAAYNGSVRGFVNYIDPLSSGKRSAVCNQLLGTDGNKLYALKSTGMFVAEFETDAGEPLQLASGHPSDVKLPIPAVLVSGAPSTIDTWSLNENGLWTKESTATKSGNDYLMQVSHFSFWNCDIPLTPVFLDMNIKEPGGNNITNVMVVLETSVTSGYGFAADFTDSLGNISGFIPAAEVLTLNIFSDPMSCSTSQYTQQIGPFSQNASLQIVAPIPPSDLLEVSGTAVNCNSLPLTNGTAVISANNNVYYTSIVNGSFNIVISHCIPVAQIEIVVIDNIGLEQSSAIPITVTGNSVNTGTITACGVIVNSFVNYNLDGVDYVISGNNNTLINALLITSNPPSTTAVYADGGIHYLSFSVTGYSIGTFYMGVYCGVRVDDMVDVNLTAASTVTFTEYGLVGEYIAGNFDIYFVNAGNHHVTGTFRVVRTQ